MGNQLLYAFIEELSRLRDEPTFDAIDEFVLRVKPLSWEPIFHFCEQMKVVRRQIRTIRRMVKNVSSDFSQQGGCSCRCRVACIIVQKHDAFGQSSSSFVLDRSTQLSGGITVNFWIYCCTCWQEFNQKDSPAVPEYGCHPLSTGKSLFEILRLVGRVGKHPLLRWFLCFWIDEGNSVLTPVMILSRNSSPSSS